MINDQCDLARFDVQPRRNADWSLGHSDCFIESQPWTPSPLPGQNSNLTASCICLERFDCAEITPVVPLSSTVFGAPNCG
jgi:hypothetical protein